MRDNRKYLEIMAKIYDCKIYGEKDVLFDLYLQMKHNLLDCDDFSGKMIEQILCAIIQTAVFLDDGLDFRCKKIIGDMSKSDNAVFRMAVCGSISSYQSFLIDEDKRVSNIALIRCNEEDDWRNLDVFCKKQVLFLKEAMEYGFIAMEPSDILEGKCSLFYSSELLELERADDLSGYKVDADAYFYIVDDRVRAGWLNNLIQDGVYSLKSDVECTHQYLQRIKKTKKD